MKLILFGAAFTIWMSGIATAQSAVFLQQGRILVHETGATPQAASKTVAPKSPVGAVWGTLPDGRIVATLAHVHETDPDALEGHSNDAAGQLALLDAVGNAQTVYEGEALRAFLSPAGDIAVITAGRDLVLLHEGDYDKPTTITTPGRVSHVSWSPDSTRIAAAVYPPDWSPHAVDNPGTTDNFLRLQNSDVYLIDAATGAVLSQITSANGTDYNPFFSLDGRSLYYIALDLEGVNSGLMRVALDANDATSSTRSAAQLTIAGGEPGEVPVGRVGTYVFIDPDILLFEGGRPDGSGEIWRMNSNGPAARMLVPARKPQKTHNGSVAVLKPDGAIQEITPAEAQ